MKKNITTSLLCLTLVFLAGCNLQPNNQPQPPAMIPQDQKELPTTTTCDKKENCCQTDDDCEYIWYTGGCNTPEYVAKELKDAQDQGINIGEAPLQENVTCTCENGKCVRHTSNCADYKDSRSCRQDSNCDWHPYGCQTDPNLKTKQCYGGCQPRGTKSQGPYID